MDIIIINKDETFSTNLMQYIKGSGDFNILNTFSKYSDIFNFMDDKRNVFDLAILDLELPELNIDDFLNRLPKGCNVIALTSYKEKIFEFINFPHFQRIFLTPLPLSNLLTYISIQNGIETYEGLKKFMVQSLAELGFNLNHSGTQYLIEGTILALKSNVRKLSEIYTLLAYKHSEDPKIIGWSVNNAINRAIKHCDENTLYNFFKIYDNRKLSAKYIISYFINYAPRENAD